jgi:hypothetical protein
MLHFFSKNYLFIWLITCCTTILQAADHPPLPTQDEQSHQEESVKIKIPKKVSLYNFLIAGLPEKYQESCSKIFDENKQFLINFYKLLMYMHDGNNVPTNRTLRNFFQLFAVASVEIPNGIFYIGSSHKTPLTSVYDTIQAFKEQKTKTKSPFGQIYVANTNDLHEGILTGSRPDQIGFNAFKSFYNKYKFLKNVWQDAFKTLVSAYKIHLMPNEKADNDIGEIQKIWIKLLKLIKKDTALQMKITHIKIIPSPLSSLKKAGAPRIVVYVHGKDNAQQVLDTLYDAFKDDEGSNKGPLCNEKVTSLIFITQGERPYKDDKNANFYEPNRVYYKNLLGDGTTYELINPGKK